MWSSIFTEITGLFRDHLKGRRDVAVAKAEAEVAIHKAKATAEINWDLMWAEQARNSLKDEFFVLIHAIPMVMAFIPGLAPYVEQGFTVLEQSVPEWFLTFYGAGVAAAFGIRGLKDFRRSGMQKEATREQLARTRPK